MIKFAFEKSSGPIKSLIKFWDVGPYCHVECILDENEDGTYNIASSKQGQGVRILKNQILDPNVWDIIRCEKGDKEKARKWFEEHSGEGYYYAGLFGFVFRPVFKGSKTKWFCSEACCVAAFDMEQSWRVSPNCMYDFIEVLNTN